MASTYNDEERERAKSSVSDTEREKKKKKLNKKIGVSIFIPLKFV